MWAGGIATARVSVRSERSGASWHQKARLKQGRTMNVTYVLLGQSCHRIPGAVLAPVGQIPWRQSTPHSGVR
jgi:hypothetical protein